MGCGTIVKPAPGYGDRDRYNISWAPPANISDLVNIVIPLFEKYPLYGAKHKDFLVKIFGKQRSIHYKGQRTFDIIIIIIIIFKRIKGVLEGFSGRHEYTQRVLMSMYLGYFIFFTVYSFILPQIVLGLRLHIVCR